MVNLGDAFRICRQSHLWVVITEPEGERLEFLMVNITTLKDTTVDTTCILHKGDHPFIKHDSVAYYTDTREWHSVGENGFEQRVKEGIITPQDPVNPNVLRRIQESALQSDYFKRKYIERVRTSLVELE